MNKYKVTVRNINTGELIKDLEFESYDSVMSYADSVDLSKVSLEMIDPDGNCEDI